MKLVIDIPEEAYNLIDIANIGLYSTLIVAVKNGKPLDEVIGNIKDELYENQWYIDDLDLVIEIIDKHISGKGQE